jgi:hypothetical protein
MNGEYTLILKQNSPELAGNTPWAEIKLTKINGEHALIPKQDSWQWKENLPKPLNKTHQNEREIYSAWDQWDQADTLHVAKRVTDYGFQNRWVSKPQQT